MLGSQTKLLWMPNGWLSGSTIWQDTLWEEVLMLSVPQPIVNCGILIEIDLWCPSLLRFIRSLIQINFWCWDRGEIQDRWGVSVFTLHQITVIGSRLKIQNMDSYAINPSQINGILVTEASFVADLVQLGYLWRGLLRHRHGHISIHESIILSEIQTKGFDLWKVTFVIAVFRASDAAIERELTMLSSSWWFFQLAYLLGKL
jgi:hypothetical protein